MQNVEHMRLVLILKLGTESNVDPDYRRGHCTDHHHLRKNDWFIISASTEFEFHYRLGRKSVYFRYFSTKATKVHKSSKYDRKPYECYLNMTLKLIINGSCNAKWIFWRFRIL
jgi:hypothetical protein